MNVDILHSTKGDKSKKIDTTTERGRQEAAILLKRLMKELPPDIRATLEEAKSVAKEYSVLSVSMKKIKQEEDGTLENV